jgi:tripartite-type tricarboxylate transporter receptor subunit TctC
MTTNRRTIIKRACTILLGLASGLASAQGYPTKPVKIIVPFAAGGSTDVIFRVLSVELGRKLGQPIVLENRPGGAASIGMNVVANAAPDGYTLGVATLSFVANPSFLKDRVPFNAEKDLVPISLITKLPLVLTVHPSVPARTAAELLDYAKKNPGKLNYGSTGIASSGHLGGAMFESITGAELTHVPYSNSGVVSAVVAGDLQVLTGPIPSSLPFIQSGRLIPLGVTSAQRATALPNVPALAEVGIKGFDAYDFSGVVAPKGTPTAVVQTLNAAILASLKEPSVRAAIQQTGAEVVGSTEAEFASFITAELEKWAKVAADLQKRPAR